MNRLAIRTGKRDPFTPWHIPRSLLRGFIDFQAYASSAAVVDLISGVAFTAAGSVALGAGANGKQCALMDGVDDCWTYAGLPTGWPSGAEAGWMFAIVNQTAPGSSSTDRFILSYGTGTATRRRAIRRTNLANVGRAEAMVGDGSVGQTIAERTVDFSGRHVVHGVFTGTTSQVEIDGVRSASVAVVPNTGAGRTRIGAADATSAANFWQGDISAIVVGAGVLPDYYRLKLYDWIVRTGR